MTKISQDYYKARRIVDVEALQEPKYRILEFIIERLKRELPKDCKDSIFYNYFFTFLDEPINSDCYKKRIIIHFFESSEEMHWSLKVFKKNKECASRYLSDLIFLKRYD